MATERPIVVNLKVFASLVEFLGVVTLLRQVFKGLKVVEFSHSRVVLHCYFEGDDLCCLLYPTVR